MTKVPGTPKDWREILAWLRSPCCREPLVTRTAELACSRCETPYAEHNGILVLLAPDPDILPPHQDEPQKG